MRDATNTVSEYVDQPETVTDTALVSVVKPPEMTVKFKSKLFNRREETEESEKTKTVGFHKRATTSISH